MSLEQIPNNNLNNISPQEEFLRSKEDIEKTDFDLIKLRHLTSLLAEKQKQENPELPIDTETARLNMDDYVENKVFSKEEVEGIKETVKELEAKFLDKIDSSNIHEKIQQEINGEKVELLTAIVLYKFLKDKFIITRSSRYDDIDNSTDTIIFNKATGQIVCTLDESGVLIGQYADRKKLKILEKNEKGGTRLKYGLILTKDSEGTPHIQGGSVANIPIFDILMDSNEVNKHLLEVQNNLDHVSNFEHTLFRYFAQSIDFQAKQMQDPELKIPSNIKQLAQEFRSEIERLFPNILYHDDIIEQRKKGILKPEFYTNSIKISKPEERDAFREKLK
ncbi:MAG: hypothetical protein ACP5RX_02525 [Minisyncoccia bacterium]